MKTYEEMIQELEANFAWYRFFICKIKASDKGDEKQMEDLCKGKDEAILKYRNLKQFASFIYGVPIGKIHSDVRALCMELNDYDIEPW